MKVRPFDVVALVLPRVKRPPKTNGNQATPHIENPGNDMQVHTNDTRPERSALERQLESTRQKLRASEEARRAKEHSCESLKSQKRSLEDRVKVLEAAEAQLLTQTEEAAKTAKQEREQSVALRQELEAAEQLLASATAPSDAEAHEAALKSATEAWEDAERRLTAIQDELADMRTRFGSTLEKLALANAETAKLAQALTAAEQSWLETETRVEQLQKESSAATRQIRSNSDELLDAKDKTKQALDLAAEEKARADQIDVQLTAAGLRESELRQRLAERDEALAEAAKTALLKESELKEAVGKGDALAKRLAVLDWEALTKPTEAPQTSGCDKCEDMTQLVLQALEGFGNKLVALHPVTTSQTVLADKLVIEESIKRFQAHFDDIQERNRVVCDEISELERRLREIRLDRKTAELAGDNEAIKAQDRYETETLQYLNPYVRYHQRLSEMEAADKEILERLRKHQVAHEVLSEKMPESILGAELTPIPDWPAEVTSQALAVSPDEKTTVVEQPTTGVTKVIVDTDTSNKLKAVLASVAKRHGVSTQAVLMVSLYELIPSKTGQAGPVRVIESARQAGILSALNQTDSSKFYGLVSANHADNPWLTTHLKRRGKPIGAKGWIYSRTESKLDWSTSTLLTDEFLQAYRAAFLNAARKENAT